MATANTPMRKARQRLHREELKLARLKTRNNKSRLKDQRLKLRLGSLCYLVGWHELPEKQLESHISKVKKVLDSENTETLISHGSQIIDLVMINDIRTPASHLRDPVLRRAAAHQQITIGGMLTKYGLHRHQKSTLLGAIYSVSEFTDYTQIIDQNNKHGTE